MKIIRNISVAVLIIFSLTIILILYFRINLPYENGKYFNENIGEIYKEQTIIPLIGLLILCILAITFIIIFANRKKIMDKNYE